MAVGEAMVTEQFLEFFNMATESSVPNHPLLTDIITKSEEDQKDIMIAIVKEFMAKYKYCAIDHVPDKEQKSCIVTYRVVCNDQNTIIIEKSKDTVAPESDELFNYAVQLCHWYLHVLEFHDTAKEGDFNRAILNCKYAIPFFYSHSKLSKYLVENIDYVLKTEYILSPLQRLRVLEGSFVNVRGGNGQNVESDLVQEHSVCNQKALIKLLGANKSETSISRVTGAADTVAEICDRFDSSVGLKAKSVKHSKYTSEADISLIHKELRKFRPFRFTPGRKCPGFHNIHSLPVKNEEMCDMKARVDLIIARLTRGLIVPVDEEPDESDDSSEEN
jgi:hypothetical protein